MNLAVIQHPTDPDFIQIGMILQQAFEVHRVDGRPLAIEVIAKLNRLFNVGQSRAGA